MGGCNSKDMAVCLVIFNPAKTKKIIENYYAMIKGLKEYPIFTLELVYEGRIPEIPGAFHITGNSVLFSKENLCRILETKIPSKYTKLAFLDADIIFSDPSWYYKASKLLDTYDVLHLFDECHWMDSTNTNITLTRKSVLFMTEPQYMTTYHPGFAWAIKRQWYNKVGFFDYAISGSGDTLSSSAWLNKPFGLKFKSLPKPLLTEYSKFKRNPLPKITYLPNISVKHLYHGSKENRKYVDRHQMLDVEQDIKELIVKNKEGLFEWINPRIWNPIFLKYFVERDDDNLNLELYSDTIFTS
jgi:hypothetical protein